MNDDGRERAIAAVARGLLEVNFVDPLDELEHAWSVLRSVEVFPLEVVEVAHRPDSRRRLVLVLLLGPDRHGKLAHNVVGISAQYKK